ncbi:MAG: hypothetical protein KatS3mg105_4953 [Gemmatales bacterium]|nr:MAG: hypothetical protein KatS3mg105_4953 [Gemmatales bacterium]
MKKLGRTFRRRFSAEEETSLPSTDELVRFLELRCRHWEIRLEDDSVLPLVARRSKRITSEAISVIARAAGKRDRQLTRELVLKQFD